MSLKPSAKIQMFFDVVSLLLQGLYLYLCLVHHRVGYFSLATEGLPVLAVYHEHANCPLCGKVVCRVDRPYGTSGGNPFRPACRFALIASGSYLYRDSPLGGNQNMAVLKFQILREGHLISVNHHTLRAANKSIKRP